MALEASPFVLLLAFILLKNIIHVKNIVLPMKRANLTPTFKVPSMIQAARRKVGMNQTDYASRLGVTQGTLCKYESGKANPPMSVIEACMGDLHGAVVPAAPSATSLAVAIRQRLSGDKHARLRAVVAELLDVASPP